MFFASACRPFCGGRIHYLLALLLGSCIIAGYVILFRHLLPSNPIISNNAHFPRSHVIITHKKPPSPPDIANISDSNPIPAPKPPKYIAIRNDSNSPLNTPITPTSAPIHDAQKMMAKFHAENVLHQRTFSKHSWSFHFNDGDGSALFINASKSDRFTFKSFQFCPVPKVGVSSWKQVIKRIKGSPVYLADDHWSLHDPLENELEPDRIHKLGVDGANQLLFSDEDIFYAIFVRDPISRALSAFLDKCIGSKWILKHWCQPTTPLNDDLRNQNGVYSQFDLFIESIINKV